MRIKLLYFLHRAPAMSSDGCLQCSERDEPHRHRWTVISLVIADFSPLLSFWSKTTILLCRVEAMFTGGLGSAALQVERTLAATVRTYIEWGEKRRCIMIGDERIMETCRWRRGSTEHISACRLSSMKRAEPTRLQGQCFRYGLSTMSGLPAGATASTYTIITPGAESLTRCRTSLYLPSHTGSIKLRIIQPAHELKIGFQRFVHVGMLIPQLKSVVADATRELSRTRTHWLIQWPMIICWCTPTVITPDSDSGGMIIRTFVWLSVN
jgi:hypothetical protein